MPAKLTPRQAQMMPNLASITTDGSRHDPQYWLDGKNVSVQVRSMLMNGLVALEEGRLIKAAAPVKPAPKVVDTKKIVNAMRDLLDVERPRAGRA